MFVCLVHIGIQAKMKQLDRRMQQNHQIIALVEANESVDLPPELVACIPKDTIPIPAVSIVLIAIVLMIFFFALEFGFTRTEQSSHLFLLVRKTFLLALPGIVFPLLIVVFSERVRNFCKRTLLSYLQSFGSCCIKTIALPFLCTAKHIFKSCIIQKRVCPQETISENFDHCSENLA